MGDGSETALVALEVRATVQVEMSTAEAASNPRGDPIKSRKVSSCCRIVTDLPPISAHRIKRGLL